MPFSRQFQRSAPALVLALGVAFGCGEEAQGVEPIVLYSGRSAAILEPLLESFEAKTGREVQVQWGASTADLANLIAADGELTPCDLFFAQDSGHLSALAEAGAFRELPRDVLEALDADFRDDKGRWVGTSGRVRVLVHAPERVPSEELPRSLEELARLDGELRFGWAPGNASFEAHVAGLIHVWGEARTREWLTAVATREPQPVRYNSNSAQVTAVGRGAIDVGWVNHYYLHKLRAQDPQLAAANYSFPTDGDPGNVLMVSGVGITAPAGERYEGAAELARFLVSPEAQRHFALQVYEYPLRSGVETAPGVPPLAELGLSRIDVRALTRVDAAKALMDEVGIR